ncbi:hypothetical protein ACFZAD_05595 [Streptomyces iakyrus]|uniref:hypothetical protein n=1 Tax=Streptomyces iakyrus TaxID=68219 RepID=UPI0036E200E5
MTTWTSNELNDRIDAAYRTKYGRYGVHTSVPRSPPGPRRCVWSRDEREDPATAVQPSPALGLSQE